MNHAAEPDFGPIPMGHKILLLLVVDSNYDFELKYEYTELGKWATTKIDGGVGIPAGLD